MKKIIILLISIIFISYSIISARVVLLSQEEILVGTRPSGMSGAFVASADNANSIGYNPAGMAFLKHNEVNFTVPLNPIWERDLKIGFNNFYAASVFPFSKIYALGIDWFHLGYSDDPNINWNKKPELEYSENKVTVAVARKFSEILKIGASLKYYNMGVSYDGTSERKGNGLGMDIGINLQAMDILRIGLLANNIFSAYMFYNNGKNNAFMSPALRIGFAFNLFADNNIELTLDDMIHLGIEHYFFNIFALRAGMQKEILNSKETFSFSGGAGVKYKYLQLDYALNYNKYFNILQSISLTAKFGYHAYLVDVLGVNIDDIFASLYKSYAKNDVVKLKVKNKSKSSLKATIGFMFDKYMDSPTEKVLTLKPNVPVDITLPIVFNNNIMDLKEDGAQSGRIIVTYEFEKEKSVDESARQFMLYSRNAFVWDDLEKLAVFVTPNDETVKSFTRGIIQQNARFELHDEFLCDNYFYTMLLFNALGEYGMTYVIDPNTPFAEISKMKTAIDYVSYPAETLKSKTGDCDDLTVLFCSCLENIGIPCAFIDVPGHIFMLFSLNIPSENALQFFGSDEYFIDMDGTAWMSLETTMFGKPFVEALKEAREEIQKWVTSVEEGKVDKSDIRIVFIEDAWKKYPSAQLSEFWEIKLPDIVKVIEKNKADAIRLLELTQTNYKTVKMQLDQFPEVASSNNEIGIIYEMFGLYSLAETHFQKALKLNPNWESPYNNLGNIYLLNNKIDKAINFYKKALKIKPGDKDIMQNISKAEQLAKEEF